MKMYKRNMLVSVLLIFVMSLSLCACAAEEAAPDYAQPESWAYYGIGEDKVADLFLICPTVDRGKAGNRNMSIDDADMRSKFIGALNMERGIYEEKLAMYAPYYRQVTLSVYDLPAEEAAQYFDLGYADVRAAFLHYLENSDAARPFVLAGFSQGADMAIRLLKEFFDAPEYQSRLIAAYCIGWRITDEDLAACPWIQLARCADDLGCAICFTTEAEGTADSLFVPAGMRTYAINPLNWRTDSTPAEASLNLGACFTDYDAAIVTEIAQLTGAYLDPLRGTLIATDVSAEDYPGVLFPDGVYHLYDYQFFYRNLQENVALRVETYLNRMDADETETA